MNIFFILSILKTRILSIPFSQRIVIESTLDDMKEFTTIKSHLMLMVKNVSPYSIFDKYFEDCDIICKTDGDKRNNIFYSAFIDY